MHLAVTCRTGQRRVERRPGRRPAGPVLVERAFEAVEGPESSEQELSVERVERQIAVASQEIPGPADRLALALAAEREPAAGCRPPLGHEGGDLGLQVVEAPRSRRLDAGVGDEQVGQDAGAGEPGQALGAQQHRRREAEQPGAQERRRPEDGKDRHRLRSREARPHERGRARGSGREGGERHTGCQQQCGRHAEEEGGAARSVAERAVETVSCQKDDREGREQQGLRGHPEVRQELRQHAPQGAVSAESDQHAHGAEDPQTRASPARTCGQSHDGRADVEAQEIRITVGEVRLSDIADVRHRMRVAQQERPDRLCQDDRMCGPGQSHARREAPGAVGPAARVRAPPAPLAPTAAPR